LEEALEGFEGTVLVISHDRYFLDRIVTRIESLERGVLAGYPGNYSDLEATRARIGRAAVRAAELDRPEKRRKS